MNKTRDYLKGRWLPNFNYGEYAIIRNQAKKFWGISQEFYFQGAGYKPSPLGGNAFSIF